MTRHDAAHADVTRDRLTAPLALIVEDEPDLAGLLAGALESAADA